MCHLFGREHVAAILLAPTHTHTHRERHTHTETVDWSLEYDVIFQPELIVSRAQLSPWSQRERERERVTSDFAPLHNAVLGPCKALMKSYEKQPLGCEERGMVGGHSERWKIGVMHGWVRREACR